jgi:tetratricopeptide (TPR) repeat protein
MTKPSNPRQRPPTQQRVPPPLVQRINAPHLPGLDLLEDESGPACLVFWQAFRDAELWARADERGGLFGLGCREARAREVEGLDSQTYADAKPYLSALLDVTESPTSIPPDTVRDSCAELASWFEGRGLLRCAVEFALVACFAAPSEALLVVRVARLLRMLGEYLRSISWFEYGLHIARKSEDWHAYTKALTGLGILHHQRGNFRRARQLQQRCARVAQRYGLRDMAGEAFHNLFVLEMDAGNVELAQSYAARALRAYSPESQCLKRLARDLSHKMAVLGDYHRALPVALETLHHFTTPVDRVLVWATIGLAAGGACDSAVYEDAWFEMWTLVRQQLVVPVAAVVLLDLARGALALGDEWRAEYAAMGALKIARERAEGHTSLEAEAFLRDLDKCGSPQEDAPPLHTQPALPDLDTRLIRALQHLRAVAA